MLLASLGESKLREARDYLLCEEWTKGDPLASLGVIKRGFGAIL